MSFCSPWLTLLFKLARCLQTLQLVSHPTSLGPSTFAHLGSSALNVLG